MPLFLQTSAPIHSDTTQKVETAGRSARDLGRQDGEVGRRGHTKGGCRQRDGLSVFRDSKRGVVELFFHYQPHRASRLLCTNYGQKSSRLNTPKLQVTERGIEIYTLPPSHQKKRMQEGGEEQECLKGK